MKQWTHLHDCTVMLIAILIALALMTLHSPVKPRTGTHATCCLKRSRSTGLGMLLTVYPMLRSSTAYSTCMRKMYSEAFTVSMDPITTTTTVGGGTPDVPTKALNWSCTAEHNPCHAQQDEAFPSAVQSALQHPGESLESPLHCSSHNDLCADETSVLLALFQVRMGSWRIDM